LQSALAQHKLTEAKAHDALAALDQAINDNVDMATQSSEGTLLHETKLHSHLAYLSADIDLSYLKPTQGEYQVYRYLDRKAHAGEQQLKAAVTQGQQVL